MMTDAEFRDYIRKGFGGDEGLIGGYLQWYSTRPPQVRALMREFPIGDKVLMGDQILFIIGYTENDMLIVSPVDPKDESCSDEEMRARREYLCADHLRGNECSHDHGTAVLNPRSRRP